MIISNFAQSDVTASIYHGLLHTPEWSGFVKLLRADTGADLCLLARQHAFGDIHILRCAESPDEMGEQILPRFAPNEAVPFAALRPERVYAFSEFALARPAKRNKSSHILTDAAHSGRVVHVVAPHGQKAWIIIARERGDFSAAQAAQLSSTAAHFKIALQIHGHHARAQTRIAMTNPATKGLNFAWIALDSGGRILDNNAKAETMIADQTVIRRGRDGRLLFDARAANARLAEQLAAAANGRTVAAASLLIRENPRLDLLLTPPSRQQKAQLPSAAIISYLHGDEGESMARERQISSLFALAPREARLALALSQGRSIAQAAQDMGISVHTARLYSKRIYAKTGTKGQADLVRLLLSSLLALQG